MITTFASLFCSRAQPGGLLTWYTVFLFTLCCAVLPARAAALATDGQTPGMRRSCTAVATRSTPPAALLRAREGQPNFFHVAARHPEKKEAASLPTALRLAPGVKSSLLPSGSARVMQVMRSAGGRRGTSAGNPSDFSERSDSAGRTLAPTAQQAEASMKEHSAVPNRRRISAALTYNKTGTAVTPAAVPNSFKKERHV